MTIDNDKYNLLTPIIKQLRDEHFRCLRDYTPTERINYLMADHEAMQDCLALGLIYEDGHLTGIGDLVSLEITGGLRDYD